jgi:hypothetical protein
LREPALPFIHVSIFTGFLFKIKCCTRNRTKQQRNTWHDVRVCWRLAPAYLSALKVRVSTGSWRWHTYMHFSVCNGDCLRNSHFFLYTV